MNGLNFFKQNGYLIKENLISQKNISKINKIVNEIVLKEKQKNKKKTLNKTQSYDNYHFVYNSNSLKNREILRLNNPQNRHKVFYELSRDKKIISIFAGSRNSEVNVLLPILCDFINLMNKNFKDYEYIFKLWITKVNY